MLYFRFFFNILLGLLTFQYMTYAYEVGADPSRSTPKAIMSEATFVDPACIADQKLKSNTFAFSKGFTNDPALNKALKWIGVAIQAVIVIAPTVACTAVTFGGCSPSIAGAVALTIALAGAAATEGVEAAGKKDEMMEKLKDPVYRGLEAGDRDFLATIYARPTVSEMRLEMYNSLYRFVANRVVATKNGVVCADPMSDNDCIVMSFKNPAEQDYNAGNDVDAIDIYAYVVYGTLYSYINEEVLDKFAVDVLRLAIAKTYSGDVNKNLASTMISLIKYDPFFVDGSIKNSNILLVKEKIKSISERLAVGLANDILFWQPMQYSSRVEFPLTSRMIECLEGTFDNLLLKDLNIGVTPFAIVQSYFQPLILMLLIIYIIIYGYKILLAQGIKNSAEIVMIVVEFSLVFYFTIGDAWQSFFFNALKSIPISVGRMVIGTISNGADGCGTFTPSMYPPNKGNLAFFDMIDCKFANYIGLAPSVSFIPGIFYLITTSFMAVSVPIVSQAVGTIAIIYFCCIIYTILLGIQIYISSVITLSVMIFLSPFTIPMALFEKTEAIYEAWLAKVIGCVIGLSFGIVVIVFVLALLDPILYGAKPEKYLFENPALKAAQQKLLDDAMRNAGGNPANVNLQEVEAKMKALESTVDPSTSGKPNPIKTTCYNVSLGVPWAPGDGGIQFGEARFIPVPCLLHHMATSGVVWEGWPLDWLYFFRLPKNWRIDIMFAFIMPAIVTMLFTAIVKKFIDPMTAVISKIGGEGGEDLFGAQKYDGVAHMMSEGKKAGGKIAGAAKSVASKAGAKGKQKENDDKDDDKSDDKSGEGEENQTESSEMGGAGGEGASGAGDAASGAGSAAGGA